MFEVNFMVGGAIFGIVHLLLFLGFVFTALFIWGLFIVYQKEDSVTLRDFKPIIFSGVLAVLIAAMLVPTTVVKPKVTIDVPQNQMLMEYQRKDRSEIEIITPEPRIEFLDGFEPLKQD